ncbi:hypothetical protein KY284_020389 [Solanum tuberosum]|nr:hypothetical protein KY284_020389 [Solanum tuberosum]
MKSKNSSEDHRGLYGPLLLPRTVVPTVKLNQYKSKKELKEMTKFEDPLWGRSKARPRRASRSVNPLTGRGSGRDKARQLKLEAQRQKLGLEAEAAARGVQQNGGNNQPRVVDENRGVDGLIPPQRQPIAPRGRAQHPAHMMYDEDNADLDGAGATRAIVLLALPPGVKFTITSTMIQLLNLKGMFRGAAGDDANQHLMNFVAIFCGGSFMRKPFAESMQLLDEVSQRKREEERDQDMTYMRTQIDLLTKHIVAKSEKVNVVGQQHRYEDQDLDIDEEAKYLEIKEVSRIITLEIRVTILEMQVGAMLGMVSMKGQQIEIKETGKTERGIGMTAVVYIYLQVIQIG